MNYFLDMESMLEMSLGCYHTVPYSARSPMIVASIRHFIVVNFHVLIRLSYVYEEFIIVKHIHI